MKQTQDLIIYQQKTSPMTIKLKFRRMVLELLNTVCVCFTHSPFQTPTWRLENPPISNESASILSEELALLFNHLLLTAAPARTLPGSNFSDKTPRGRWALTEVTHTVALFQSNHNCMFHFKGLIYHFWMRDCEPSPLMKTRGALTPPEPINTTGGGTTRCWAVSAAAPVIIVALAAGDETPQ